MIEKIYANQFQMIDDGVSTRSAKLLEPIHSAIANFIEEHSNYRTQAMPQSEYKFIGLSGEKKVDIAIFDSNNTLKGVIMFKGIRASYNKNANNYYENMKGESSLFIDSNIPVYQICLIPSLIKVGNKFEKPGSNHIKNYSNFNITKSSYWNLLKLGIWIFDIDYSSYDINYSNIKIQNVEDTIEEGLLHFIDFMESNG